jgi:hypothetical protein
VSITSTPSLGLGENGLRLVAAGAVAVAALLGTALMLGPLIAAAALVSVMAAFALAVVPRYWLWAGALCTSALIPIESLPVPHLLETYNPAMFVVVVLAIRTVLGGRSTPFRFGPQVLLLLAFTAWLLVTVLLSTQKATASGWMVSFLFLAVVPTLVGFGDRRAGRVIETTWIVLGAVLGSYALVEAFVLHANPLLAGIYASGPSHLDQHFAVYRATTTLGNPVSNGLFFVVAVPLGLGRMVARDRFRWSLPATVLATGGVIASGTRTALIAALISGAVVLLGPTSAMLRERGGVGVRLAVAAAIAVTMVVGVWYLAARNNSAEGSSSASFRSTMISVAREGVAESPVVGVGPGMASVRWQSALTGENGAGAFESMWLEIVVGSGLPGLALGVALFTTAVGTALRGRATPAAAAMVAFLVTGSGFNIWEGGRAGHVRIGLLLVMTFAVARSGRELDAEPSIVQPGAASAPLAGVR